MKKPFPADTWLPGFLQIALSLSLIGLALGFGCAMALFIPSDSTRFWDNRLESFERSVLFAFSMGGAALGAALALVSLFRRGDKADNLATLHRLESNLAPLAALGMLPLIFRWRLWQDRPLPLAITLAIFGCILWLTTRRALSTEPYAWQKRIWDGVQRFGTQASTWVPLGCVMLAAVAYTVYFSYHTIAFHQGVYSGFDLGIKNNIFWNTLHGSPFKASITMGPSGPSHFGLHSDLLVYPLLPFYWLYPHPETILVFQALFSGAGGVALFFLLRSHAGPWTAALVAMLYLLHPALHGANIFEFHFILFGLPLLWAAWACLERRHYWAGAIFVVLTLSAREDVALWVVILGLYFLLSGKDLRMGFATTLAGTIFFLAIKFWIMPWVGGGESFTFIYEGLMPEKEHTLLGALKTVVVNPPHTLATFFIEPKLIYFLQIFLPVALLSLIWPRFWLLALPGVLFTLLPPHYRAVFDIRFQYGPHWLAFLFPAAGFVLAQGQTRKWGQFFLPSIVAMIGLTLASSYHWGAVLQQNTAHAGPRSFRFGFTPDTLARRNAIRLIHEVLPTEAKVACSSLTAPQFSSRPDAYDMNVGWFDADYAVFPSDPKDFIEKEKNDVLERLGNNTWGIVRLAPPFALAKKGHSTQKNGEVLSLIK